MAKSDLTEFQINFYLEDLSNEQLALSPVLARILNKATSFVTYQIGAVTGRFDRFFYPISPEFETDLKYSTEEFFQILTQDFNLSQIKQILARELKIIKDEFEANSAQVQNFLNFYQENLWPDFSIDLAEASQILVTPASFKNCLTVDNLKQILDKVEFEVIS